MSSCVHPRRYSFVTIGFEGDAGLLRLQARSMRLFCPRELVEEIIIVDNSSPGSKKWQDGLLKQYGNLAGFVRIVPAAHIAVMNGAHGWFSQQVLKIKVAEVVCSDRYVVLDSKNHLITHLGLEFLETSVGQPRINGHSYVDQPMREFLERTLEYLGLDPQDHIEWFTRTTTPFTLLTNEVHELVRYVEQKEAKPFAPAFLDRKLSEFFLYAGFLVAKGTLLKTYDLTQVHDPQIWPKTADVEGCTDAIRRASQIGSPFMTIHRQAIPVMKKEGKQVMGEFWRARGLFASAKDGVRFLSDPNRCHQDSDGHVVSWPLASVMSRLSPRSEIQPSESLR